MNSIIAEISKLRKNTSLIIDYKNSNRYRIVAIEQNGSKTAYYFNTPIYNDRTRKLIDMKFHSKANTVCALCSNADISISSNICIENSEGSCLIPLDNCVNQITDCELVSGNQRVYPTTNGVAIRSNCQQEKTYTFSVDISKPFLQVRANDKYFALMSEKFRPFIVISCIGTCDANGNIISPAKISYEKITDRKYNIMVTPCSPLGKSVLIEANLYEEKLFQDTTVESKNPGVNNAFGSIAFIGNTNEFGEQWLYTRPDFAKMSELNDKKILNAILHLQKLNNSDVELTLSKVIARFCSFGSTWDNKIAEDVSVTDSETTDQHINLDLTSVITDKQGRLSVSEGFIVKTKNKNSGFSVINTGDSYLTPQILEINYR